MNSSALAIPVRHSERADAFLEAEEDVCVKEKLPVDELIFFDVSGLSQKDIGFGLLVGEDSGSGAICQTTDYDHQE